MRIITKYPAAGDMYSYALNPDHVCKIVNVLENQVTIQWTGQRAYINEKTVPLKQFVIDFRFLESEAEQVKHEYLEALVAELRRLKPNSDVLEKYYG